MRLLNHVRTYVDTGGPKKRKASDEGAPRIKRSCFRLHRTSVSKRVTQLGTKILTLKKEYLSQCDYVGLIIDEGNNFARSCPLYAAVMTCDSEFNWRIQFIGQADCEGHKDGEAIFKLVKKIFIDQGMLNIWEKFVVQRLMELQ